MSEIGISPEDRKRLAKIQFDEWLEEGLNARFPEKFKAAFAEAIAELRQPGQHQQHQQGQQGQQQQSPSPIQPQQPEPQRTRRRSLFEECFSQTFGL